MRLLLKILCVAALALLVMTPEVAEAQILNLDLNNSFDGACIGGTTNKSLFQHTGPGPALCNSNAGVFARFFCVMETTLGLVIAKVFCSIRDAWMAPFGAMMMLLMAVTGLSFITGIIEFSVKEVSILMFKLGLVTLFVTNPDAALGIAYKLYIGIMQTTVEIMTKGFADLAQQTGANIATAKDQVIQICNGTKTHVTTGEPTESIDITLECIREAFLHAKNGVVVRSCSIFTFLLLLLIVIPPVTAIFLFALLAFLGFFARAAYGYVYALVMVTFLLAAMPIFASFALFRSTNDLFEHWLKYIGSNVIQIIIVFAIMAFASMVDFTEYLAKVDSLIVPYELRILTLGNYELFSFDVCSICSNPNFGPSPIAGGIPVLGSPACLAPTDPAKPAMEWGELIRSSDFIKFLLLHGVVLYLLTLIMDNFMKIGPDIAKMLGGAKLVHTIGGLSTMGSNAVSSALHTGSVKFEHGFKQSWKTEKSGNVFTRSWKAIRGGGAEARHGEYDVYGKTERQIEQAIMQQKGELGRQNRALYATHKEVTDRQTRARRNAMDALERYKSGEGDATWEEVLKASRELKHANLEHTRSSRRVRNITTDLDRVEDRDEMSRLQREYDAPKANTGTAAFDLTESGQIQND